MEDKTYGTLVTDCGIQLIAAAVMEGQPVHHHLHAGGPAGVAAILAQVRHVDKDIGILGLPVIGWLNG